jgi:hypothetical protein
MGDRGWGFWLTGIFKLQRLRNLHLKGFDSLSCRLDEVLWNLQVLSAEMSCYGKQKTFPYELDKFPYLRELSMRHNFENESKAIDFLEGLHHLRYLQILRFGYFPMLPIDSSSFPLTITKLTIIFVGLGVGSSMTML